MEIFSKRRSRHFVAIGIFFSFIMIRFVCAQGPQNIKAPNVQGQFYPEDKEKLSKDLDSYLSKADVEPLQDKVGLLIVPHAGYLYSAQTAAYGYKAVSSFNYSAVVIIALSHFSDVEGFAIWPKGGFETPLGVVAVDDALSGELMNATATLKDFPPAFEKEHSLEVQLPFLQKIFPKIKIVPILTGRVKLNDCRDFADALAKVLKRRDDVLVVVSTDLSHYHSQDTARRMDGGALSAVKTFKAEHLWAQCLLRNVEMCNFSGTVAGLFFAQEAGLDHADILKYATSAQATKDPSSVVGYASVIFTKTKDEPMKKTEKNDGVSPLTMDQKKRLLDIARHTIESFVRTKRAEDIQESDPRLNLEEGAFVTIHKHGRLRGCIGNILGRGPLYLTVRDMAIAAATSDPRFKPLSPEELSEIDVEVSVLSTPKAVKDPNEIQMGIHGVIVSRDPFHSGVFLPQVATETKWSREEFLSQLCSQKAGLSPDAWKNPGTKLETFTAQVFSQKDITP